MATSQSIHPGEDAKTIPQSGNYKIFNDPIHGHIKVREECVRIIDTPEFQRLRYLKQLGTAYYVYPGAPHNRFEHSIGVYHLAGEFVRILRENQPELEIDDDDMLCVQIAGLCHDLGHGPFSHLFDRDFIPSVRPEKKDWKHEDASIAMLDHLIKKNLKVKLLFDDEKGEQRLTFIKELIYGPLDKKTGKYNGRPKEKQFLYEIVSNKRNGIDVDKFDYFARDCHMLGIKNNFDHVRYMMFARVINASDEGPQICARDKEAINLYNMFHTRATLHKTAYKHKVTTGIDSMILDVLKLANEHILIPEDTKYTADNGETGKTGSTGETGKTGDKGVTRGYKMSDTIDYMDAYSKLNDGILQVISLSSCDKDSDLFKAQEILKNLHSRQLYKCIGQSIQLINGKDKKLSKEDIEDIKQKLKLLMVENESEKDDIEVVVQTFNYGMKDKDPIEKVKFYSKRNPKEASALPKIEVSTMLPEKFEETLVIVYSKDVKNRKRHQEIFKAFEKWCEECKATPRMGNPKSWLRSEEELKDKKQEEIVPQNE